MGSSGTGHRGEELNLLDILKDSARFLKVYDRDLILSWRPCEYRAFLEGAQQARIDDHENMVTAAIFNRVATTKQKLDPKKDMFDADKVRNGNKQDDEKKNKFAQLRAMRDDLKNFKMKEDLS